ncbi:MAG: HEAT repeat domain-containing protein [Lentisphaeria bacterium]
MHLNRCFLPRHAVAAAITGALLFVAGCGGQKAPSPAPEAQGAHSPPAVSAQGKASASHAGRKPTMAAEGPTGRSFVKADAQERQALEQALKLFKSSGGDAQARLDALSELMGVDDKEVLTVAQLALAGTDPEQRRMALELLADFTSADILPLVTQGLGDADPAVRQAALAALAEQHSPAVAGLLAKTVNDNDEETRAAALSRLFEEAPAVYAPLLHEALASTYPEVREKTLDLLFENGSPAGVEALFAALDTSDAEFREQVNDTLDKLISQRFNSAEEARTFWQYHRNEFDAELNPTR